MPQQIKLSENEFKTIAKLINNIAMAVSQVMAILTIRKQEIL
jgi:hypothetical protein